VNLTLALTHRCNLRCTYCYAGKKFRRTISKDVICKGLDIAFKHPSPRLQVSFFGGEPLLEPDLIDYAAIETKKRAKATGKSFLLSMTTNGTRFTEANLDLIERHKIHVAVSLDGDREAQNSARVWPNGRGSFRSVDAGLRRALARLGRVDSISVVHPKNVHRMPDSFSYLASLGVRRFAFNMDYDSEWTEEAILQLERSVDELMDRALDHYRAGNNFTIGPYHAKIVSRLKGGFCDQDQCDFGCAEIAVAPSGRIYPCDRLIGEDGPDQEDLVIGHVDNGVDAERVWALKKPKDEVKPDCEGCAIIDRCMWWCGCVNHTLTGKVDEVSGLLCHIEQI